MAQEMTEWDTDADSALISEEFSMGWGSAGGDGETAFSAWDEDNDGALSEDEYNAGVFGSYDEDESNVGDDRGDGGFWDV